MPNTIDLIHHIEYCRTFPSVLHSIDQQRKNWIVSFYALFLLHVNKNWQVKSWTRETRILINEQKIRVDWWEYSARSTSVSATASLNQLCAKPVAWVWHTQRAPALALGQSFLVFTSTHNQRILCDLLGDAVVVTLSVVTSFRNADREYTQYLSATIRLFFFSLISFIIRIIDHSQINAHCKVHTPITINAINIRRNSAAEQKKSCACCHCSPLRWLAASLPHTQWLIACDAE